MAIFAFLLAATVAAPPTSAPSSPPPAPARTCTTAEDRQFDFWLGHWDVTQTKDGAPAGKSFIEKLYGGCTLRENYSAPGFTGGSLNTYVASDKHWHQTWTDSAGTWREYVGGISDGKMVLVWTHPSARFPGKTAQERVTLTPNPDGSVRQYSDASKDGVKWVEVYDYTYRHPVRKKK